MPVPGPITEDQGVEPHRVNLGASPHKLGSGSFLEVDEAGFREGD